jgi:hypothetical protein
MWAEGAQRGLKWPEVPHDDWGNARYFVKWHGTVTGPGQYGHMGFSPFVIRIDSVFELRAAQDIDCK